MQLHNLQPSHRNKTKKRIARGGKRGTYSGRGIKGQRSRAGHRVRPAIRDLIQRLPKLRGHKFRPQSPKPLAINLDLLARKTTANLISPETLLEAGITSNLRQPVKILGGGEISRPLSVKKIPVSRSAHEKIIAAGGKIE